MLEAHHIGEIEFGSASMYAEVKRKERKEKGEEKWSELKLEQLSEPEVDLFREFEVDILK